MRSVLLLGAAAACLALAGHASAQEALPCATCHPEVDAESLAASPHGFLECADCHPGAAAEVPHAPEAAAVDCATCHPDVVGAVSGGVHADALALARAARARRAGEPEPEAAAPPGPEACGACHGSVHAMHPAEDPRSPVHPRQLPGTCGDCHADPALAEHFRLGVARPPEAYRSGVHARAAAAGKPAPGCPECHGAHGILGPGDPASPVHFTRVAQTCGACHEAIARSYLGSVHGTALAEGVREAPTCTDCHGEHRILAVDDEGSPVQPGHVPKVTCGRCHGDLRLAQKFGLDPRRVSAFDASFHGLALRSGATTVAHCGSCHGVHGVLPSSDPRSSIHPDHLPETCGQCHPGAGTRFPIGPIHVLPEDSQHLVVRVVRVAYLALIFVAVGVMALHNGLDFWRKARSGPRPAPPPAPDRERMPRGFRIAHGVLVASFAVLVYTGFALKYPEAGWAAPLLRFEEALGLRALLHRAAAIALLGALAFHGGHLLSDRRARACMARMLPTRDDGRELRERVAWMLGRRTAPPRAAWVGYPEKVEYWALLWGVAVMTVTGLALWANDWVLRWLPKWVSDLATVVHWYEAVLATLAILIWHFYFVIFDPVVYPMDTAWLTGRSHPGRAAEREPPEEGAGR